MIVRNSKELVERRFGQRTIAEVRRGLVLVWQAIRSCFGAGWWVNEKPWIDEEGWKNE